MEIKHGKLKAVSFRLCTRKDCWPEPAYYPAFSQFSPTFFTSEKMQGSNQRATTAMSLAAIRSFFLVFFFFFFTFSSSSSVLSSQDPQLGSARVVFQTNYGDIEFGFYPTVAPRTVDHIFKLVRLGCYNTNHFFRVDRGFVAQVSDVVGGRTAPMNDEQREEAEKTVVGEFSDVKHVRGILSMGRYDDPNSASSSFSILLGNSPHLDGQYAVFGKVTKGDATLRKLEELPTRREGIFVMPVERITILSSYYYGYTLDNYVLGLWSLGRAPNEYQSACGFFFKSDTKTQSCEEEKETLKRRLAASATEIERWRIKCFT